MVTPRYFFLLINRYLLQLNTTKLFTTHYSPPYLHHGKSIICWLRISLLERQCSIDSGYEDSILLLCMFDLCQECWSGRNAQVLQVPNDTMWLVIDILVKGITLTNRARQLWCRNENGATNNWGTSSWICSFRRGAKRGHLQGKGYACTTSLLSYIPSL